MPVFTPPDNILYACAATGHGPANLVPIYAIGRSRIKHLVILRAVADPDNPNETERREAIATAERLQLFGFDELGLGHDQITVLDGDPDSVLGWAPAAQRIAAISADKGLHLIINLTGGPKQLALGLEHHLRASAKTYTRVFYSKYPAAPLFLFPKGNDLVEGHIERPAEVTPLDILIEAARFEIVHDDPAAIEMWETAADQPDAVRAIWPRLVQPGGAAFADGVVETVRQLNIAGENHPEPRRRRPIPFIVDADARNLIDPDGRLGIDPTTGEARTRGAIRFAAHGGWLECVVARTLADALATVPRSFVDMSLTLRTPSATGATDEVDVFVRLGDQLHLVEVKARTSLGGPGGEAIGKAIGKLGDLRRRLGGTACRAWLVAPFLTFGAASLEEWNNRAGDVGVTLLVGPAALHDLVAEVEQLA